MKKLTAITLCIVMVCSSMCTIACVTDQNRKNAQFFAADFSILPSPEPVQSLSGGNDVKIVSWLRNPEISSENKIPSAVPRAIIMPVADKLVCGKAEYSRDFYTSFKTTEYFLRI